jgi:hypothetical protein
LHHAALGDIRVQGVYSGFSADMSTGVTFGLKLPTGDWRHTDPAGDWDRDTQIGTGSTDLLLGAYHMGTTGYKGWAWYASGTWDQPVLIKSGYRPGAEFNVAAGAYYDQWTVAGMKIVPIMQVIGGVRLSDRGPASSPDDSGYKRVLLSPGIEVEAARGWRLNADVAIPVYQQVIGNQLIAQELFKVRVSYDF